MMKTTEVARKPERERSSEEIQRDSTDDDGYVFSEAISASPQETKKRHKDSKEIPRTTSIKDTEPSNASPLKEEASPADKEPTGVAIKDAETPKKIVIGKVGGFWAWKAMFSRQPNIGNYARDALANERTYLAWVRTSLALVALGVALAEFGNGVLGDPFAAGLSLIATAFVVFVFSSWRFFFVQYEIECERFQSNAAGMLVVAIVGTLVLGALFFMVLLL